MLCVCGALFSVAVGYFWRSKGLSFGSGVFWSILLSAPVGFVIGLVKQPDPKQQEANQLASGVQRKCPSAPSSSDRGRGVPLLWA